jgi:hypothetical protein
MFPSFATLQAMAIGVAIYLVVRIGEALIHANVVRWAERQGLDSFLTGLWEWLPVGARRMIAGWPEMRRRWWLWLLLGASIGIGIVPSGVKSIAGLLYSPPNDLTPSAPPAAPSQPAQNDKIATSLKLQFGLPSATPSQIASQNTRSAVFQVPEAQYHPCPPIPAFQSATPSLSEMCLNGTYSVTNATVIILLFDRPISYKGIVINGHGGVIPKYTVEFMDKSAAGIFFDGEISHIVIDITTSD